MNPFEFEAAIHRAIAECRSVDLVRLVLDELEHATAGTGESGRDSSRHPAYTRALTCLRRFYDV